MSNQKTPLFEEHQKLKAKMVPFGGWEMPVSYSGVLKEHQAVRMKAGLFDVSHMGEILIEGPQALDFLQYITSNDLNRIVDGQCQYNLLMNPQGGVVDDIIIHRLSDQRFFLCVNASNTEKDFNYINALQNDFQVTVRNQSAQYAQLALQGPLAQKILKPFIDFDLSTLKTFYFQETKLKQIPVLIARTGYTGEDGFEIYLPPEAAASVWNDLLHEGNPLGLLPCGLGCRDTLRLEMAYPLYGHELSDSITPLEAKLAWVVRLEKENFLGKEILVRQKQEGLSKKRIGFVMLEPGIAREKYLIFSGGKGIGEVCSGTYSPSLDKSIGCGYVPESFSKIGTKIDIEIRGKMKKAAVVETPFYRK
ncbi:MAG: glycine cleavage system aminomethyltransferase GcvT [Deltaproteobacteria bacterium]|nr:glycine cleavage system aminomethyltransferase GcvT [Deltaproteobacteria bacterium]